MAAVGHLGFSKLQIFSSQSGLEGQCASPTKFHQNWLNSCQDIAFNGFQNGGCLPSWIFKN